MRRTLGLLLLLAGCAHNVPTGHSLSEVVQPRLGGWMIDGMEASRKVNVRRPESLADRQRWYIVLGRLQDPSTVDLVIAGLADLTVIREAAFAAGQLGLSWEPLEKLQLEKLATAVQGALTHATVADDRASLLNALGKLGQPASAPTLLAALTDTDAGVRREAAQGLGALAHATKGTAPELNAIDPLNAILLHDNVPEVRFAAAYALMRTKRPESRPGLTYGLKDASAMVRAVCARGLGEVATESELSYLLERLGDKDQNVQVESARSLGKLAGACAAPGCPAAAAANSALLALASGYDPARPQSGMALLALVQEKLPASLHVESIKLADTKSAIDAHARTVLACSIAAAADRARTDARTPALNACKPVSTLASWHQALVVRTLGQQGGDPKSRALALLAIAPLGPLSAGAIDDALGELKLDTPEIRARILADLASPDWGVALSAADAAGKLSMTEAIPGLIRAATLADINLQDDALATVLGHLATLHAPRARELALLHATSPRATARSGARAALKILDEPLPITPLRPLDVTITRGPERTARIVTERGEIRIALHASSFTAERFASLARRGFFDELTFHRVVPGFVVQGGDPRGDGSGGPGFELPCEIDRSRYLRGAVGMALSGKDTGGSQFFITLEPQPHLEGKYTIFADVTAGMEVADRLMEGDRIVSLTVEP
jgi:cyclophilin family peptidyl-prolyl cis-trans isomerase